MIMFKNAKDVNLFVKIPKIWNIFQNISSRFVATAIYNKPIKLTETRNMLMETKVSNSYLEFE